ncbi:MAG: DUF2520 domain-containing protein [Proteobacteria bacterium]|nr:MAG: DUF2520 domain-containing protein [Pseudomonadota bacterium]
MPRQVPKNYLLIGDGRLARHLAYYFAASGLLFQRWSRRHNSSHELAELANQSDHILLLISDDGIEAFIQNHPLLLEKSLIHCSGSLNSDFSQGCHPLMTFGDTNYPQSFYPSIPFICDEGFDFEQTFPQLENPHYSLPKSKKAGYHALAVMAGNFPQFIWKSVFAAMTQNLHIPHTVLHPLIQQSMLNSFTSPETAPTGPFVRGDRQTIQRHKQALQSTDMADLYNAFDIWLSQQQAKAHKGIL